VVNLGTLTMDAGLLHRHSKTALNFTVANLIRQDGAGGPVNYDMGILGRQGAAGSVGQTAGNGGSRTRGRASSVVMNPPGFTAVRLCFKPSQASMTRERLIGREYSRSAADHALRQGRWSGTFDGYYVVGLDGCNY
jgi:hypothetical protein